MKNITIEFFFIILTFAFSMGLAQVIFSLASDQIFTNLKNQNLFNSILKSHWIYIGLFIYVIATIAWIWILSKVDLRFTYQLQAYPLYLLH